MKKIDILVYKMDSSDSEFFIKDVLAFSRNSIVLLFDFEKIVLVYKPEDVGLRIKKIPILRVKNYRLFCLLSPIFFSLNFLILFFYFLFLCLRCRPKVCWMENVFAGLIIGLFRRCGLCRKAIYVPGDWLVNLKNESFFKYIGNNVIFPLADYFACRFSDLVLHHSQAISDARTKFWGKRVTGFEKPYIYRPRVKISLEMRNAHRRNKICFLGQIRKDSGLDLILNMLSEMRQEVDMSLVVIGPKTHEYEAIKKHVADLGLQHLVEFYGFVKTEDLSMILADCFCGLNILTSKDSYSSYALPGKLMHYIQHLLPVVVSEGIGYFSGVVQEHGLGQVIEARPELIKKSLLEIHGDYDRYRENILRYIKNFPSSDLKELIAQ